MATKKKSPLESARIERIGKALVDICSPFESDYIDDSEELDTYGRTILWRLGMLAWNAAIMGYTDVPMHNLEDPDTERERLFRKTAENMPRLVQRKNELYPQIHFAIDSVRCVLLKKGPHPRISLGTIICSPKDPLPKSGLSPKEIISIRESTGLTSTEFAKQLGIAAKRFSAWECGKEKPGALESKYIREFEKEICWEQAELAKEQNN